MTEASRSTSVNVLVAGLYAWVVTVALPAFSSPAGWMPRLCAMGAMVALLVGALLLVHFPGWGRMVTLIGFLGLSAVTWITVGDGLSVERLDPVRGSLGGVGWMLFAFGWGAVRRPGSIPENDPHVINAEPLTPRDTLPRGSALVLALAVLLALAPWFSAWRAVRPEQATLTHAAALACSVAMIAVGARVSVLLGRPRELAKPPDRLSAASSALAGLVIVGMLGLMIWAFRG